MPHNLIKDFQKREARIFISSTFRDMMNEREVLVKKVFPELRKRFKNHGITITEVDLRWGVLEEEAQSGKVIDICLSEIDKSRPYFIGLLGERYGWMPEPEEYQKHKKIIENFDWVREDIDNQLSITEMEIQYGVLRNDRMRSRAFFYLRDPQNNDSKQFYEDNPVAKEKLQHLKNSILKATDIKSDCYLDSNELAAKVFNDLSELIEKDFPPISEAYANLLPQLNFINSRTAFYVNNPEHFSAIKKLSDESDKPVVVTGNTGIGKSTLLANYLLNYIDENPESICLFNFCEASADSTDYIKVIQRFYNELTGEEMETGSGSTSETITNILRKFVTVVKEMESQNVLMVLDGLDEFMDDEYSRRLDWLPEIFPENLKVLCSCGESAQLKRVEELNYNTYKINGFTKSQKSEFIQNYFNHFSKKLPPAIVDQIIADDVSILPLTLKSLAGEIRQYGLHEGLNQRVQYYLQAKNPVEFYDKLLARLEEDFDKEQDKLVKDILSIMSLFRDGVKEIEILEILNITPLGFSTIYNAIDNNILNRSGYYILNNSFFKEAIECRYLNNDEYKKTLRNRIVTHLVSIGKTSFWNTREVAEIAHQLMQLGDKERMYELLSNFNTFFWLQDCDRYALIKYCLWINDDYNLFGNYTHEVILDYLKQNNFEENDALYIYFTVVEFLNDIGDFHQAIDYCKKLEEFSSHNLKISDAGRFNGLISLINLNLEIKNTDEALKYATQFFELATNHFEPFHPIYMQSYYHMGKVQLALANYDKAIQSFHQVIMSGAELTELEPERDFLEFEVDLFEEGARCHIYMGMPEEAIEFIELLLEFRIAKYGEFSPEVIKTYKSFMELHKEIGNHEQALHFGRKAYETNVELLGKKHPITLELAGELDQIERLME